MTDTEKNNLCPIHSRRTPCLSCRGAKGGSVSSPKKSAANRRKAKKAAMARWSGKRIKKLRGVE